MVILLDFRKNSAATMVFRYWNGLPKKAVRSVFGGFSQTEQIPIVDDLGIVDPPCEEGNDPT